MIIKVVKILVFGVGAYYILKFLVRLYNAKKKMDREIRKNENTVHPVNKKSIINPEAGEYTDYEEIKD